MIVINILLLNLGLLTIAVAQSGGKGVAAPIKGPEGIDVSELTDVDALGFLSPQEVKPWGNIFSDETERIFLAGGDTVYVAFKKGHHIKPGDLFTVFHSSSELEHPLAGSDMGYVVSFLGRLVLKQEVKPDLYKAEIVECYSPMRVGDPVLAFTPLSPCVQISNPEWERFENRKGLKLPVAAAKDLNEIIGQFSVVYMNHGHKHGIRRGNLFEIVSSGQPDQPKEPALPDQVIGHLLVLEARPNTSAGIVVIANREFSRGTMLKAIDLNRELKKVATHYGLELKNSDMENNPLAVLNRLNRDADAKPDLPESLRLLSKMPKCPLR